MNNDDKPTILKALQEVSETRHIPLEKILTSIEDALRKAYEKQYGCDNVSIEFDRETSKLTMWARKTVVETVKDPKTQLTPAEAREMGADEEDCALGNEIEVEMSEEVNAAFGRIAAQTARQVLSTKLRDIEREAVRDEFSSKINDIMTVTVQRSEHREFIVDIRRSESDFNHSEGVIPVSEQSHNEYLRKGDRIKVMVAGVRDSQRGPQVVFSRSNPGLLKRLFELSVPEISRGIVSIKAVVREAGLRSKIAVKSNDPSVDPVGACVGPKGTRVQGIVDELRNEKIDVIPWSEDVSTFISNALQPAVVTSVTLGKDENGGDKALVIVADKYLPLAIGREGQNARLAAKLTGWHIDIRSESSVLAESAATPAASAANEEADTPSVSAAAQE